MALAIEQVLAALEAERVRYLVVGGVAVVLHVSVADLIALKQASGRPIDLADVDALRALGTREGGAP